MLWRWKEIQRRAARMAKLEDEERGDREEREQGAALTAPGPQPR
jgi:hypothetical protein